MSDISHIVVKPEGLIIDPRHLKKTLIDYFFKHSSLFIRNYDKLIKTIGKNDIKIIHEELQVPSSTINDILSKFLYELQVFRDFLNKYKINWYNTDSRKCYRHIKICLHKMHRFAPVFNYKRARENLVTLHKLINLKNFLPHLTTQLALIIFITNKKNGSKLAIPQKNIRALCNCSAYAFHGTRNKLDIEKYL